MARESPSHQSFPGSMGFARCDSHCTTARVPACPPGGSRAPSPGARSAEARRGDGQKQEPSLRAPAERAASQTQRASFQPPAHATTAVAVPLRHTPSPTASWGWGRLPPLHPETPRAGTSPAGGGNSHIATRHGLALPCPAGAGSRPRACLAHPSTEGRFGRGRVGKRTAASLRGGKGESWGPPES